MGPLAIAMLANAGLKVMGGIADNSKIEAQARIEQATNDLNAATQRVGIAQNYTGIFEKMVSDLLYHWGISGSYKTVSGNRGYEGL